MILVLYSFLSGLQDEDTLFSQLLTQIPVRMQEQVFRYKKKEDRYRYLIGKILLQKGFDRLGMGPGHSLEHIQYTAYSRPFLPNSPLDFNVSHSGSCVVCAMSDSCRLGIDVERIEPVQVEDFIDQMSHEEWERIRTAKDRLADFYRYWTEKECVIKANGKGLSIPLKECPIIEQKAHVEGTDWFIREIVLTREYICHLATDLREKESEICLVENNFMGYGRPA